MDSDKRLNLMAAALYEIRTLLSAYVGPGPDEEAGIRLAANLAYALEVLSTNAATNADFDLRDYSFVRRSVFVTNMINPNSCGNAGVVEDASGEWTPYGQYNVTACRGTTYTHEFGHLMGLRHGGEDDNRQHKPNHWSVMSYDPEYRVPGQGTVEFWSRSSQWAGGLRQRPAFFSDVALNDLDESDLDESQGVSYNNGAHTDEQFTFQNVAIRASGLGTPAAPVFQNVTTWMNWNNNTDASGNPIVDNSVQQSLEDANNCICNPVTGACVDQWNAAEACDMQVLVGHDNVNYLQNLTLHDWSTGAFATQQLGQAGLDVDVATWALPSMYGNARALPAGMSTESVSCQ